MKSYAVAVLILASCAAACSNAPEPAGPVQAGGGGGGQAGGSSGSGGAAGAASGGAGTGGMSLGGASGAAGSAGSGGASGSGGAGGSGGAPAKFVCPAGPFPAPDAGEPQSVCQGFQYAHDYNEGPTWVAAEQAFFFSNFVRGADGGNVSGQIIKYTPGGDCERYFLDVGTNGLAVSADGNLLGASHKTRSISKFDLTTLEITVVANMYMTELLDSPNDLILHSNGTLYFTNPTYELGGREEGVGPAIFRRDASGTLSIIEQGYTANGIALSPEEDRLYVVGAGVFDLDANGLVGEKHDFPLGGADGLAVDCAGNVYLSNGSIRDPDGNDIGNFPGGTNLAFGGEDGKTLFVVGGGTDTRVIQMNLPGLP